VVPSRRPQQGPARAQTIVRGPAASHPPEACKDLERRPIARQPLHASMGMRRSPLLQQCTPMPGGLIPRADHLGIRTGRRGARHIPEVRCKRPVPALRCALARLGCAARGLLEPAGRQLPRHPMERRHPIDLVLVIPRADGGAMPLHPARGPSRRHQGQAGCVLAPQHARPSRGCFFHAARASRAACCS
jgi:hypothetical protein